MAIIMEYENHWWYIYLINEMDYHNSLKKKNSYAGI